MEPSDIEAQFRWPWMLRGRWPSMLRFSTGCPRSRTNKCHATHSGGDEVPRVDQLISSKMGPGSPVKNGVKLFLEEMAMI